MKIFITGATGFIGKHLVEQLVLDGCDVTINVRNDSTAFNKKINKYCLGINGIEEDIEFFKKESFDGIIHLASLYLTIHKPAEALKLIDSNLQFSTYVLECAVQAKIYWFINTGTFWQHYQNSDYSPINLYAATKQAFESIAKYYIETRQINFCTLKLSDTYGPNDTRTKVFNIWQRIVKSGETLDMSPGEQLIDISYIDDVVAAFILLAKHLQKDHSLTNNGVVYAVKANKRFTLKQLACIFENITQNKLNINWGGRDYKDREVMVPWEGGDVVPGWEPKISIETGIRKLDL